MKPQRFEYLGVEYAIGVTACGKCGKGFGYSYHPGYPPSSLAMCYDCDPVYKPFDPSFCVAKSDGFVMEVMVETIAETKLFEAYRR